MENKAEKVTVIMSNYNQEKYIKRAIESVLAQETSFNVKLLIVDDYSIKDSSRNIILEYQKKYENIDCILSNENKGYLENILRAKRITKTPYFCLLDADDYWIDTGWLQCAYDFLEKHEDYSIYEANVLRVDEDGNTLGTFVPKKVFNRTFTKEQFLRGKKVYITQTTGTFFRNCIFSHGVPEVMEEAVGTLSERSFEGDFDRFIMHLKHGKAYYCRKIVGAYRITPNGIWARLSESKKMLISARSYCDYYRYYKENDGFFRQKCIGYLEQFYESLKLELVNNVSSNFDKETVENYNYIINFINMDWKENE